MEAHAAESGRAVDNFVAQSQMLYMLDALFRGFIKHSI